MTWISKKKIVYKSDLIKTTETNELHRKKHVRSLILQFSTYTLIEVDRLKRIDKDPIVYEVKKRKIGEN